MRSYAVLACLPCRAVLCCAGPGWCCFMAGHLSLTGERDLGALFLAPSACHNCPPADLASGAVTSLVEGSDFYACPRLSPDGSKLAWVCWEHPNMPWDDTQLWVADVAPDGTLGDHSKVSRRPAGWPARRSR